MKVIQPWVEQGLQRIHIHIDDTLGNKFRKLCKQNRMSLSRQIEELIRDFVKKSK